MFFSINHQNGVPVYEQVARQVTFAVADGTLVPGDLLPSVRELARDLAINPNTVARAYRDLQAQGLVEQAPGIGLAVRRGTLRDCQTARRRIVEARVAEVLDEAFHSGLEPAAIRKMVDTKLAKLERAAPQEKGSS